MFRLCCIEEYTTWPCTAALRFGTRTCAKKWGLYTVVPILELPPKSKRELTKRQNQTYYASDEKHAVQYNLDNQDYCVPIISCHGKRINALALPPSRRPQAPGASAMLPPVLAAARMEEGDGSNTGSPVGGVARTNRNPVRGRLGRQGGGWACSTAEAG